jgi:hypothetical protein
LGSPPFDSFSQVVDLLLRRAVHLERDRFVEVKVGAAVQRRERLRVELEGNRHDGTRRPMVHVFARLAVSGDCGDPRVLED